jgi:hypothetical protein
MGKNLQKRLDHLQQEHSELNKIVDKEYNIHTSDAVVHTLKKKKLKLKDEIEKVKKRIENMG